MRLERTYEAEAAHQLTAGVPAGHQCRRLHGHRYCFTVTIIGDVNPATGMILEYAEIDRRVNDVLRFVDHNFINELGMRDVPGPVERELAEKVRENSTVENLARWFIAELKHRFADLDSQPAGPMTHTLAPQVYSVRIEEDSRSAVEV